MSWEQMTQGDKKGHTGRRKLNIKASCYIVTEKKVHWEKQKCFIVG